MNINKNSSIILFWLLNIEYGWFCALVAHGFALALIAVAIIYVLLVWGASEEPYFEDFIRKIRA